MLRWWYDWTTHTGVGRGPQATATALRPAATAQAVRPTVTATPERRPTASAR